YSKLTGIYKSQTSAPSSICEPASPQGGYRCWTETRPTWAVDSSGFYQQINDPFADADPETALNIDDKTPALEFISTMPVVTRVVSSAPTAEDPKALAGVDYAYEGMKLQAGGRGSLGFKKLS